MNTLQSFQDIPPQEIQALRTKEPRVVVIREEFIALTGNPLIAAVLNQLVYWSQRVTNLPLYLEEEREFPPKCSSTLQYGWFYKSSAELIEETMLRVTPVTLRRYLNYLEESGWIETRTNPQNKWDRTAQYRVKLRKLCNDLQNKGYTLPGFLKNEFFSSLQNGSFEEKKIKKSKFSREVKNDLSKINKCSYEEEENSHSNGKKQTFEDLENDVSNSTELIVREERNEISKFQNVPFEEDKISHPNEKKQSFESLENDLLKEKKLTSRMENNLTCNTEITTENTHRERVCARF